MLSDRDVVSILVEFIDETPLVKMADGSQDRAYTLSHAAAEILCTALLRPDCADLSRFLELIATGNPLANPQLAYKHARDSVEALLRVKRWIEAGLYRIADIEIEEAVK